jgi:hypothetical protein
VGFIVIGNVLGSVVNFTSAEELLHLGLTGLIKNDTKSSSHVDNFAFFVHVNVLARVSTAVAQDVIESIGLIRLFHADGVVVSRFSDLSEPGANRHKLLTSSGIFSGEEIVFGLFSVTVVDFHVFTSFLVKNLLFVGRVLHKAVVLFLAGSAINLKLKKKIREISVEEKIVKIFRYLLRYTYFLSSRYTAH